MKTVLLGCPFKGLEWVGKLLTYSFPEIEVIFADTALVLSEFGISTPRSTYYFEDVDCAFIRYPYDLIPPHTRTFSLRENTERIKTLALLLESKSLNPISNCWKLRNRLFSLNIATRLKIRTPRSWIVKCPEGFNHVPKIPLLIKSIGNCFVDDDNALFDYTQYAQTFVTEHDDGDFAVIYPAQSFSFNGIDKYLYPVLVQELIETVEEYRVYIIGQDVYGIKRIQVDGHDQSAAPFSAIPTVLPKALHVSLLNFAKLTGLLYVCFDFILDKTSEWVLVDVNPLGALPSFEEHPEVSKLLANEIFSFASRSA
tara:strand:+ start:3966 stop:4901 length:936 start_codon:yes stop_codon:yes gene_type:complete